MQVTVLRDKRTPGMVESGAVLAVDPLDALARDWDSDAHFAAYEARSLPVAGTDRTAVVRLRNTPGKDGSPPVFDVPEALPVRMLLAIGDVDDPEAHATKAPASQAWRSEVEPRLDATGLLWYRTRGGARVVARLAEPVELSTREDAETWKRRYLAWCDQVQAEHGVTIDRSCNDWSRLFRLPRVQRDGVGPQRADVKGGARPVITLPPPGAADAAPAKAVSGDCAAVPADLPEPSRRAQALAEAIGERWLDGGRVESHAALHLFGWLLGRGWSKGEVGALLKLLDAGEVDAAKQAEHWHILGNARPVEGPGGFREWCGEDWEAADSTLRTDPVLDAFRARQEARRARLAEAGEVGGGAELNQFGDFADRSKPPPELVYVVPSLELAPGKVSALQAYANGGKTPIALLLMLCIAAGRDFLGHTVVQCPTLFVAWENPILAQEREARLCAGLGLDRAAVPMSFFTPNCQLYDGFVDALERHIRDHRIGVVAIDTYTSALPDEVEHNSSQFGQWLRRLGQLSDATGCLVLVLMHENKSDKQDGMRGISGHNSAAGALQAAIRLEPRDDAIRVSCTRAVRKAFEPFAVRFRDVPDEAAPTGSSLVAERLCEAKLSATRATPTPAAARDSDRARRETQDAGQTIVTELRHGLEAEAQPGYSYEHLRRQTGLSRRPVEVALRRLKESGLVEIVAGLYSLTDQGRAADAREVGLALAAGPERFARS